MTLSLRREREEVFKAISPYSPSSKKRGNRYVSRSIRTITTALEEVSFLKRCRR
jgi:hypothetical protein